MLTILFPRKNSSDLHFFKNFRFVLILILSLWISTVNLYKFDAERKNIKCLTDCEYLSYLNIFFLFWLFSLVIHSVWDEIRNNTQNNSPTRFSLIFKWKFNFCWYLIHLFVIVSFELITYHSCCSEQKLIDSKFLFEALK